jgi:hypothetical protein
MERNHQAPCPIGSLVYGQTTDIRLSRSCSIWDNALLVQIWDNALLVQIWDSALLAQIWDSALLAQILDSAFWHKRLQISGLCHGQN